MTTISILGVSLLLGFQHSFEPDHIIAVTNIVTESKKVKTASSLGFFWGMGHTLTLLVVGVICMALKLSIPENVVPYLESLVGIMLITFGVMTLRHSSQHKHHKDHHHFGMSNEFHKSNFNGGTYSFLMGIVHGISGSASLILIALLTAESMIQAILFIIVFGIGTTLSMMLSTSVISLPFVFSKENKINTYLTVFAGALSITFGVYYFLTNVI